MEPLVTVNLSDEDITSMIRNGLQFKIKMLSCHSPAAEKHVQMVAQTSLVTCGAETGDRHICSAIKSRNELLKLIILSRVKSKIEEQLK